MKHTPHRRILGTELTKEIKAWTFHYLQLGFTMLSSLLGLRSLEKSIFVILLVQEKEDDNIPSSDMYPWKGMI